MVILGAADKESADKDAASKNTAPNQLVVKDDGDKTSPAEDTADAAKPA